MSADKEKEVVEAVLAAAREEDGKKKLSCPEASALAEKLGVSKSVIGQICNRNDVRLCKCQLGCFP